MPRPTQDNDITSSLNDMEIVLSDSEDDCQPEETKNDTTNKTFPWLQRINKMLNSAIQIFGNFKILKKVVQLYTRNASKVLTGYCKMKDLDYLKQHLSNTLLFIHFYWREIRKNEQDRIQYFINMADLLSVYIELQIRTLSNDYESNKVSAQLLNYLNIYLDKSNDHIARTLLQCTCKSQKYREICIPLFRKCFCTAQLDADEISDESYLRYLLVLLCWRDSVKESAKRAEIELLGVKKLGENVPWSQSSVFSQLIPKPPNQWLKNETVWLMQPYSFDMQKMRNNFIYHEAKLHGITVIFGQF